MCIGSGRGGLVLILCNFDKYRERMSEGVVESVVEVLPRGLRLKLST